jgi:hypothetical protein
MQASQAVSPRLVWDSRIAEEVRRLGLTDLLQSLA